ncbi:hypothetical protein PMIN04_009187 [Paraphaeosphaeria minitans]
MDHSKTVFLDLAVEVGLMVYSHISLPLTDHLGFVMKSLMLSCKKIKAEMEQAIIENIQMYLDGMKKEWTETYGTTLHVSTPATVLEVKKGITVTIPGSFFVSDEDRGDPRKRFPTSLLRILPLHVDNIMLKVGRDVPDGWTESAATGFVKDIYGILGIEKTLKLDNGEQRGVSDGCLCADSLTVDGNLAYGGWRQALRRDEEDDYWFEKREEGNSTMGSDAQKTWHRLCEFGWMLEADDEPSSQDLSTYSIRWDWLLHHDDDLHAQIEESYDRDLPTRH